MSYKYLAFDCETGGVEVTNSLLSCYFVVLNEQLHPLDELELFIKPKDQLYKVTAEALSVNKINLVEHDKNSITETKAGTALYEFLKKNTNNGEIKLVPIGHNVNFDIAFVKEHLLTSWNQYVSYRALDTSSMTQFFVLQGKLPPSLGALEALARYLGISVSVEVHTARVDTLLVLDVLERLLKL